MQAQFVTAQEVAEIMGVSRSKAYQIVREMNRELKSMYYTMELNGHKVLVLDYWHPANQFPEQMNYYGLAAVYQLGLRRCALGESV